MDNHKNTCLFSRNVNKTLYNIIFTNSVVIQQRDQATIHFSGIILIRSVIVYIRVHNIGKFIRYLVLQEYTSEQSTENTREEFWLLYFCLEFRRRPSLMFAQISHILSLLRPQNVWNDWFRNVEGASSKRLCYSRRKALEPTKVLHYLPS